jgi:hypothetical protein
MQFGNGLAVIPLGLLLAIALIRRRTLPRDEALCPQYRALAASLTLFAAGGVLAMAMLEAAHFWIANGVFAAFVAGSLVSSGVKLVTYRRGF